MSMKWFVHEVPLKEAKSGTKGEPFAVTARGILTKEQLFVEDDERKSSARSAE